MNVGYPVSRAESHGPIAVIDVETTGLFPHRHDRVVEIAAVVLDERGVIEREFVSLVNPSRDVGPSSIHGLASADIIHAPQFGEIAGALVETLQGTVAIAAHNVRFDRQFLLNEFERIDADVPELYSVCTMELAGGGSLGHCCDCYGVTRDGNAHHALGDARAAARLLAALLPDSSKLKDDIGRRIPIRWPTVTRPQKALVTREASRHRQAQPPSYLQRLMGRAHLAREPVATEGSMMAYAAVLDRVLEDRHISDAEGDSLVEMATQWGLNDDQIHFCHRHYLRQLVIAALADGVVPDAERRDLRVVAKLLGQDRSDLDATLRDAQCELATAPASPPEQRSVPTALGGKRVCFTGEHQCTLNGKPISREMASALATSAGLDVVDNVSRKLDFLVLADPESQSGKARKARAYGVRILHEAVFWKTIGIGVD
jgi:DNA polymerase-3 subunit epsilon